MKPVIGVMPLWDDQKKSIWMLPDYLDAIIESGGIPFIFPFTYDTKDIEKLVSLCDGFLFTGGHDVNPKLYGEDNDKCMSVSCETRDEMEYKILMLALMEDKSILGICRGIQFINVALNGSLYQDLAIQYHSEIDHHMNPPYNRGIHKVHIKQESPLFEIIQKENISVNSYHHQAIRCLSPHLKIMATSEDGLIEAVYMPEHRYVWAFQWHPEYSYKNDENSMNIFKSFIKSCK